MVVRRAGLFLAAALPRRQAARCVCPRAALSGDFSSADRMPNAPNRQRGATNGRPAMPSCHGCGGCGRFDKLARCVATVGDGRRRRRIRRAPLNWKASWELRNQAKGGARLVVRSAACGPKSGTARSKSRAFCPLVLFASTCCALGARRSMQSQAAHLWSSGVGSQFGVGQIGFAVHFEFDLLLGQAGRGGKLVVEPTGERGVMPFANDLAAVHHAA